MSNAIDTTTVAAPNFIASFWDAITANHLIYPTVFLTLYGLAFVFRWKRKVKHGVLDVVELYALGHALGLGKEMIFSSVYAKHDTGGMLGGLVLGIVTLTAVYKIFEANKIVVNPIPKFSVKSANFGVDGNEKDVMKEVNQLLSDGKLNLMVGIDLFDDPIPNTSKRLKLDYDIDGKSHTRYFPEGNVVQLP